MTTVGLALKDPPMGDVALLATVAEDQGLSHILTTELSVLGEPATGRDPFIVSSVALAATCRLRVGTGVAGSVFHTSRHLALTAASLNEQSDGRFILGIGVAHKVFADHIGSPYPVSPISHIEEYLGDLRRYNSGGLAFGAGFPVWLGALGDRMLRTAAVGADAVLLNWVTPQAVRAGLDHLLEHDLPRPKVAIFVRVGQREQLRAMAETYRTMFANYGRHFARQALPDSDSAVDQTCAALNRSGSLDNLSDLVTAYSEAGVDHVLLYPADLDTASTVALARSLDIPDSVREGS